MFGKKGRIPVKKTARRRAKAQESAPGPAPVPVDPDAPRRSLRVAQIAAPEGPGVPSEIIDELEKTRGWVLFAAVLQFIAAAGCLVSTGVFLFGAVGAARAQSGQEFTLTVPLLVTGAGALLSVIGLLVFLGLGLRMVKFAAAARALDASRGEEDLEVALVYLQRFWTLLGASLLPIILIPVLLLLLVR